MSKLNLTIEKMNALTVKELKSVFAKNKIELPKNTKKEGLQRALKKLCSDYVSGYQKVVNTTIELQNKEEKSQHDYVRIANNLFKIEDKTLSQVYKRIKNAEGDVKEAIDSILGKSKLPTFKEFAEAIKPNANKLYSVWNGLLTLKKFNKIETTRTKVARQTATQKAKFDKALKVA